MLRTLRRRLTVISLGLATVPLLVVGMLIAWQGYGTLQQQALEMQGELAQRVATEISAFFQERENELDLLSNVAGLTTLDLAGQEVLLLRLHSSGGSQSPYSELVLIDSTGQEIGLASDIRTRNERVNRADDEAFINARQSGQTYYSPVRYDTELGEPIITVAKPIVELRSGQIAYVLLAELRIRGIWELIGRLAVNANVEVYVVDALSQVVAHRNPSVVLRAIMVDLPPEDGRAIGIAGADVVLATRRIQLGEQVLVVVAEQPYDEAIALATRLITTAFVASVIALLVAGVVGLSAVRNVVSPIERLARVAQQIRGGDFSLRANMQRNDEIGALADAFDMMTTGLQELVQTERTSRALLENTVAEYTAFVQSVASGDLTSRLSLDEEMNLTTRETLHVLGINLNKMVESLREMTLRIRENAATISSATMEILAATNQQLATASEQNAAVTQTMATVEEVRATVVQTEERAQLVASISAESFNVSRIGQESVADSVAGMNVIQERVEAIANNILLLSERTQQIGEIIQSVNEIAEQSKLLALNASIEAARAGEEGRGFAVVAMEVRQLAEQSREATARVSAILNEIQQATNTAVMVTEEGSKGAASGMQLVSRAGDAIRDLAGVVEQSTQAARQIAASTQQQSNGMNQLVAAMQSIKQASNQAAASSKQAEQSVHELNEMARQMEEAVAGYRL